MTRRGDHSRDIGLDEAPFINGSNQQSGSSSGRSKTTVASVAEETDVNCGGQPKIPDRAPLTGTKKELYECVRNI